MISGSHKPWLIVVVVAVVLFLVSLASYTKPQQRLGALTTSALDKVCDRNSSTEPEYHFTGKQDYKAKDKPKRKVVGLLFVGRKRYVQILECYVARNLARNGGWLDEVVWIVNSKEQGDLDFLETVIHQVPEYSSHMVTSYEHAYQVLERNITYVKIDDDVVFFEDNTIPAIVKRLDDSPQYLAVSANVMNQPALAFVHYHLGAIHPYLPELEKPEDFVDGAVVDNWRVSNIPQWEGELEAEVAEDMEPSFQGHRWRRLSRESDLVRTPAGKTGDGKEYTAWSKAWGSWAIAAQQHYSFLENLEKQELWRYKFEMWNYFYERLSINFIAFRGEDLIDYPMPDWDDEGYLTQKLPLQLQRPAVLDGHGIAVHFGFGPQTKSLNSTDLLGRYRSYADEFICGKPMGSPRW